MFYEKFCLLCEEFNRKPNNITKELGLSSATATHWKKGDIPKGETLILLADYFNVSIDWLLDRTENRYAHKS